MSIAPPPRADSAAIRSTCVGRVDARELVARRPRRLDALPAEPAVALQRGLERHDPRRPLGVAGDVVRERRRRGGTRTARHAGYRTRPCSEPPPSDRRRGRRRRGRAVRRAHRRPRRAPGSRSSPRGRSPRPRPTGRRAASPPRSRSTTRPRCTSQDTLAAGPRARPPLGRRGAVRGGARALRRPRGARRALRRRPPRQPRARPRGRPRRSAASSTPAAARPAGGSCASSPPTWSRRSAIEVLEGRRVRALLADADGRVRRRRRATTGATSPRARVILATGGAAALWSRTTNPPGSYGSGLLLARAAGADARRPRVRPVPPDRGRRHPRPRGLPRHRGGPRRGRDAARRRRASASSTSSRRATPSRARSTGCCVETGAPAVYLDMTRDRPGALPERRRRAARGRATIRRRERDPGLAGEPLRDGRDRRPTSTAARTVAGPVRRRRVRLHRPARRQPAGLQLAVGVLRLRPPRRAGRARRAGCPARGAPAGRRRPTSRRRRRARRARRCGATPGSSATPRACARLLDDPHPLARLVAACALPREESRGAHARADFPATDPALDERHSVVRAGRRDVRALRQVDVSVRRLTSNST